MEIPDADTRGGLLGYAIEVAPWRYPMRTYGVAFGDIAEGVIRGDVSEEEWEGGGGRKERRNGSSGDKI